jgi:hypothetical protein
MSRIFGNFFTSGQEKNSSLSIWEESGDPGKVGFGGGERSATIMTLRKVMGGIREWKVRALSVGGKFKSPLLTSKKKTHTGRLPRMSKTLLGHREGKRDGSL